MTYVPRMQGTSANWIGEGRLVYSTGNIPNTPFANNPLLLQAQQNLTGRVTPNLPVVVPKPKYNFNFSQMIKEQAGISDIRIPQGTPNLPVLYTGRATGNTGRAAEIVNLPILSRGVQTGSGSARVVNLPVVAERAASHGVQQLEVLHQAVNEVQKPSFWSSLKNGFKNIFSKAKTFFKSPKGIYTLIGTAVVVAGSALWGYVADRFSDKNKPTPSSGPSKVFMPRLEAEEQKPKAADTTQETKSDEQETSSEVKQNSKNEQKTENKEKVEENQQTDAEEKTDDKQKTDEIAND